MDDNGCDRIHACPPVLGRDSNPEQAQPAQLAKQINIESLLFITVEGLGFDLFAGKSAQGLA
jgi:hypothetical protein